MNYDYMLDCLKAYGVSNITLEYSYYDGDSNVTMELPYTGLLHLIKDVSSKASVEEEVNIELSFEEFMDFSLEK